MKASIKFDLNFTHPKIPSCHRHPYGARGDFFLSDAAFEFDAEKFVGFYGELHGQLFEYFFTEAIYDE